ncbi:acyl-CoA dehydrogenase family protein [Streptomyces minutiscleroticus]|uniref:Butyryl-CoA dehydrogenase n=1 Tax=Streptomyces minutiscleroticus TaxID=68238 RepID=A0A918NYG0_9ACTN|nr:acyl-CoA dehydrogenase family protein [Streptomyces minutiscleroticus]GGY06489.1 butyryl-CoA dehydrogenase [Streptomyces minutiscleroticus]
MTDVSAPPAPPAVGSASLIELIGSHARDADQRARFPVENMAALRAGGYLGYLVPSEYGGEGGSLNGMVSLAKELAGACMSTALIWAMHCQQVDCLVRHADAALKAEVLPRIASGEIYLASVTTGSSGGSLMSVDETLTDAPDREFLTLGRTAPVVTGGEYADAFLVTMRESGEHSDQGVSLVYAPRTELTIRPFGEWNPMGMRATASRGLRLEGMVRRDRLVGRPGQFREISHDSMIPLAHLAWSACWLGAAQKAFSGLLRQIGSTVPADRSSPLVQERIARIRVDLELVNAYLRRTCDEIELLRERGHSLNRPDLHIHVNTLKLAASELTFRAVDRMVQLAGLSVGYSADSPLSLERVFRDLRSAALNYSNDRLWTATGVLSLIDRSVHLL